MRRATGALAMHAVMQIPVPVPLRSRLLNRNANVVHRTMTQYNDKQEKRIAKQQRKQARRRATKDAVKPLLPRARRELVVFLQVPDACWW